MISLKHSVPVRASLERCFDLTRSIDVHRQTGTLISARVEAGKAEGLSELGDSTTWSARFYGLRFRMTTVVYAMDAPHSFAEYSTDGLFRFFGHRYSFERQGDVTLVTDELAFRSPVYPIGFLVDSALLRPKLEAVQIHRLQMIASLAQKSDSFQSCS